MKKRITARQRKSLTPTGELVQSTSLENWPKIPLLKWPAYQSCFDGDSQTGRTCYKWNYTDKGRLSWLHTTILEPWTKVTRLGPETYLVNCFYKKASITSVRSMTSAYVRQFQWCYYQYGSSTTVIWLIWCREDGNAVKNNDKLPNGRPNLYVTWRRLEIFVIHDTELMDYMGVSIIWGIASCVRQRKWHRSRMGRPIWLFSENEETRWELINILRRSMQVWLVVLNVKAEEQEFCWSSKALVTVNVAAKSCVN